MTTIRTHYAHGYGGMQFAHDFADRPHGPRHFVGYRHLDYNYAAYWTKARAVVVRHDR